MEELATRVNQLNEKYQNALKVLDENKNVLEKMELEVEEKSQAIHQLELALKVQIASLKGKKENTLTEINRLDLQQDNHRHQIRKLENDLSLIHI